MPVIPIESDAHWHQLRAKHVGASEVSALFGVQPPYALSHFALWQVKAGKIPPPAVTGSRPEAGRRFEDAIAHWVAETQGWKIRRFPGYASSDTVPGLGATPDYEIIDHPDGPGLLECKSVDWLIHKKDWENEPPPAIGLQLQTQFAAVGEAYKWGAVGAVVGGNTPIAYPFGRRPKLIRGIEVKVGEFWQSIRDGIEPPTDASASTAAALRALFPESEPAKELDISGDDSMIDRLMDLKQARLDKGAAEATERAAANFLLRRIGDAELIKSGGVIVATAKTQHKKAHQVKASVSRPLLLKESA